MRAYFLAPLLFTGAGLIGTSIKVTSLELSKQETSVNIDSGLVKIFNGGFKASIADFVWISTLMESDLDHYKGGDLGSWLYLRFLLISQLDPYFYENYLIGGQYLMIIKDDLPGAIDLMERGLALYPEDMQLNWQMGFLWAFEKRDSAKAYPFFEKVSHNPHRPPLFDSLFTRLKAETLGPEDAYAFAYEAWKQQPEGTQLKERLGVGLYGLKAEIDLNCLNAGKVGCSTQDFDGRPYLKKNGAWITSKPLKKTRLNRSKKSVD